MFKKINSIKNSRFSNPRIFILIGLVILLVGLTLAFLLTRTHDTKKDSHPKYSTTTTQSQSSSTKDETKTSKAPDKNTATPPTNVTSEQVSLASKGIITITDLDQSSGYINAKASVSDFNVTQCVYSFTAPDAKPVVRQQDGSCEGVSIPEAEFEIIGTYKLTVTAYNGIIEKISTTKDIDVQ